MYFDRSLLFIVFVSAIACTPQGEPPESAVLSESTPVADAFAGSWTLVSWTRTSEGGEKVYPYGEDAFGRICYQPNGKMAAILMRRDRPKLSTDRQADLTPEDRIALGQGFFAYSGTYLVDYEKGTVTHRVEACSNPNWVGTERVRKFEREGENRIVLRPAETALPTELVWQREQ